MSQILYLFCENNQFTVSDYPEYVLMPTKFSAFKWKEVEWTNSKAHIQIHKPENALP